MTSYCQDVEATETPVPAATATPDFTPVPDDWFLEPTPMLTPTILEDEEEKKQSSTTTVIEDEDGTEIVVEIKEEGFERNVVLPPSSFQKLSFDEPIHVEAAKQFDKESNGFYSSTRKRLEACKELPVDVVWQHFSPYYTYRWSNDFVKFSALFLAIWERESRFQTPRNAVHVNLNCKNFRAALVEGVPGKSIRADLFLAEKKLEKLQKKYSKCSLKRADFGPMQWNYHWRLSRKFYRPHIEKALLLSSKYRPRYLRDLEMQKISRLVQFNPHALFVLAGLSFRDQISNPKRILRQYNSSKKYQNEVYKRYTQFLKILEQKSKCAPEKEKPKKKSNTTKK